MTRRKSGGRGGFNLLSSPLLSLLLLLLLPLLTPPRVSAERSPTVVSQINPCRKTPKFDPSCTRSVLFFFPLEGALSLFFLSLFLRFTLYCCSAAASRKKGNKKKGNRNHNAGTLFDLARSRTAESRRGGPEGPCRGSAVSVGGSGGAVEQGGTTRTRIEPVSLSLIKKQTTARSSRSGRRKKKNETSFSSLSLLLLECPLGQSDIAPPSPLEPLSRAFLIPCHKKETE